MKYLFVLDVSVEGLEAEIVYLEQQIITTETQLQSLPPTGNEALELIIQLSAYEDTLQVTSSASEQNIVLNMLLIDSISRS